MSKKVKILTTILLILATLVSIGFTYYETMIKKDFTIIDYVPE